MAYLDDSAVWEAGVRQLEETDDCDAGVFNVALGQLTHRTKALAADIVTVKADIKKTGTGSPDGWGLVADGRNLLDVLGVTTVADAIEALHQKINASGVPDFSGLQIGDYLDLASINDGTTTYTWYESYKNLRIVISGFNTYKHMGSTENAKNHIVFTFENCPFAKAMHSSSDNTGGYPASTLRTYLEGGFLTGLVAALGHDYMYSVRRYISNKGSYTELNAKIFLPTEIEVYGMQINGDELGDSATDYQYVNPVQLPIYRDSYKHRVKRYNGSRQWWWLSTPRSDSATSFCVVNGIGYAVTTSAGSSGGCAPAFCVA